MVDNAAPSALHYILPELPPLTSEKSKLTLAKAKVVSRVALAIAAYILPTLDMASNRPRPPWHTPVVRYSGFEIILGFDGVDANKEDENPVTARVFAKNVTL